MFSFGSFNASLPQEKVLSFRELIDTLHDRAAVTQLLDELLKQREQLATIQSSLDMQQADLSARAGQQMDMDKELDAKSMQIAAYRAAMQQQQALIDQRNRDSERRMLEVERRAAALDEHKAQLDMQAQHNDAAQRKLDAREQLVQQMENDFNARQVAFSKEIAAYEAKRVKVAATLAEMR